MANTTRDIMKSRERKPRPEKTGTPVLVRLQDDLLNRLDAFRRQEADLPSRAEAIRRVLVAATRGGKRGR